MAKKKELKWRFNITRKLASVLVILLHQRPQKPLQPCSARMLESRFGQLGCGGQSPALYAFASVCSIMSLPLHEIHPERERKREREREREREGEIECQCQSIITIIVL